MSQRKLKQKRQIEKIQSVAGTREAVPGHSISEIIRRNWLFLVILSVIVLGLFFNGLRGDFVSDDYATILNNTDIHSLDYFLGNNDLVRVANFLIGNIFGVSPLPYHLFSVLVYILTCWLAFIFLNLVSTENVARIALSIFAIMPIHVEAVTWISGKPYLFVAAFVLTAAITYIKFLETGKMRFFWYTAGSFILGLLTDKPRPFSLFLILGLYLITVNKNIYWKRTKTVLPFVGLVLVAAVLLLLPMVVNRVGVVNSGYNATDSIFYNPFFQYPTGIPKYLQLIFFPFDLTLYHTMYILPIWLNWLIFLTFLTLIGYAFKKQKGIFFALSFFVLTLLPSMAPVKVSWLVAERYGYLPSLGVAMFIGIVLDDIWKNRKTVAMGILGVWSVFFLVRTYLRNIDWQTNHKLWVNTCQVSPNSHNAWNNIGDDYDKLAAAAGNDQEKLKNYENSIKGFTQSTMVKPNYADAYHNRANILYKIGRLDLARDSYETALYYSPNLYQTYLSLVQIDLMENKIQEALNHANKAVQLQPNDPQSAYVLAVVLAQGGEFQKAQQILTNILNVFPNYTLAAETLKQVKAAMVGTS